MGIYAVQRTEFVQQVAGRLGADPGNTGNIVRAVAHQGLQIDQPRRGKAILRLKYRRGIVDRRGLPGLRAHELDRHMRIDQLQAVAVAGQNDAVPTAAAARLGHRADHVVGLPALTLVDWDVHRFQHLLHDRHLHGKLLRHRVPCGLVAVIFQVAEGRPVQIKGNAQRVRRFLRRDLLQNIQKAEDRVRVQAVARRQRPHAVKRAVDDAVAVQNH